MKLHVVFSISACLLIAAVSTASQDQGAVDSAGFISVGGIDQWVAIKREDRRNTPVLFIHGGPGDALSPFSDKLFADWEPHFTLIQWDQPGAGRTFAKTGPEIATELTVDRIVRDGIDVAEFALDSLGHGNLILVGTSWGSIVGTRMVRERPDLFRAYIGVSQVVSMKRAISHAYGEVLGRFERAGNRTAVADLERIGLPPWDSLSQLGVLFGHIRMLRAQRAPDLSAFADPHFTPADFQNWLAADEFSQSHFFGPALDGELMSVDLLDEPLDFSIPVYVYQGTEDLIAPAALATQYLDALDSPEKKLRQVSGVGHELLFEVMDEMLMELVARFGGD